VKKRDWLFWLLAAIAVGTCLAGGTQIVAPSFVLGIVGGSQEPAARFFFALVGMFMLLFGGLALHALFSPADHPVPILWAALQKLGAAVAVWIGVQSQIFSSLALAIAGFDFITGVLLMIYWRRIQTPARA
jgi:hypothetical protein